MLNDPAQAAVISASNGEFITARDWNDTAAEQITALQNAGCDAILAIVSTAPAGDWQGYLGAAFEYDFTETLRNEANGVEIRGGESIRGATGIGEAGLRHAKAGSPWLFDVRLRGYCGKREGASLKLQAEYGF